MDMEGFGARREEKEMMKLYHNLKIKKEQGRRAGANAQAL